MAREAAAVDISTMPDLVRLAEEVARTGTPRVLRRGDTDIAILSPAKPKHRFKGKRVTEEDIAAALATFGTWKDLDAEKFLRELDAARSDNSPPVEL